MQQNTVRLLLMRVYKMKSCVAGRKVMKLFQAAIVMLFLSGVVLWVFLPRGNSTNQLEGIPTTRDPAGVDELAICPPIQSDPANALSVASPRLSVIQPTQPCVRCAGRAPDDGRWFNFSTRSVRFFAYSAFFDDRSGLASDAVIRVIGVSNSWGTWSLHCLLRHDNGVRLTLLSDAMQIGTGLTLNEAEVVEYIFTCSAGNVIPYAVSIVEDTGMEAEEQKEQEQYGEEKKEEYPGLQGQQEYDEEQQEREYDQEHGQEQQQQQEQQKENEMKEVMQEQVEQKQVKLYQVEQYQMEQNQMDYKEGRMMAKDEEPVKRTVSSCMPVQLPFRQVKRDDFAVCVPVAYKAIDPYRLIEWFELQRILGVSRVGVAYFDLNQTSLEVLEYYKREGFLDLHKTDRLTSNPGHDHRRLHSTPTINDCILRYMHQFNWILVLDFDEFILPRRHRNLRELVNYLDEEVAQSGLPPATSYVFRNNYFFLDLPPDLTISPHLTVLRYREKVAISGTGYSVKSMINPRACKGMHNHYCWGRLAGYSKHLADVKVAVEDGLNHHYKKCHFAEEKCRSLMENITRDDVMLRFRQELTSRVREKVRVIMDHDL